jgi:hypothetical protein
MDTATPANQMPMSSLPNWAMRCNIGFNLSRPAGAFAIHPVPGGLVMASLLIDAYAVDYFHRYCIMS